MNSITMNALAQEHIRDLRVAATRSRLVALASRCRPATWRRAAARIAAPARAWIRRSQMSPQNTYCAC